MWITERGLIVVGAGFTSIGSVANVGVAYVFSANVTTGSVVQLGGPLLRPGIASLPFFIVWGGGEASPSIDFPSDS